MTFGLRPPTVAHSRHQEARNSGRPTRLFTTRRLATLIAARTATPLGPQVPAWHRAPRRGFNSCQLYPSQSYSEATACGYSQVAAWLGIQAGRKALKSVALAPRGGTTEKMTTPRGSPGETSATTRLLSLRTAQTRWPQLRLHMSALLACCSQPSGHARMKTSMMNE